MSKKNGCRETKKIFNKKRWTRQICLRKLNFQFCYGLRQINPLRIFHSPWLCWVGGMPQRANGFLDLVSVFLPYCCCCFFFPLFLVLFLGDFSSSFLCDWFLLLWKKVFLLKKKKGQKLNKMTLKASPLFSGCLEDSAASTFEGVDSLPDAPEILCHTKVFKLKET